MSDSYKSFSYVYDKFMDNIPYDDWCSYLHTLFKQYGITCGTLIDIGCGTGTVAINMTQKGYSIIGIDNSIDMLSIAADKTADISAITLLCQDMTALDLGEQYDGAYCICDSLNYLLTASDVYETFCKIKTHLQKGGIFIFDLKTPYFYEFILGDQVFCDHQDDCSYTWENSYFEDDMINQYDLTIFTREGNSDLYKRFTETHHQKAYHLAEMIDLLTQAGLEYITSYDAFTTNSPNSDSERIYIIARNGEK